MGPGEFLANRCMGARCHATLLDLGFCFTHLNAYFSVFDQIKKRYSRRRDSSQVALLWGDLILLDHLIQVRQRFFSSFSAICFSIFLPHF
jgi:hypothetical protein